MTPESEHADEDDRLSRYHVTARVEIATQETLLAGKAEDAVKFHRRAVEQVCEEVGADLDEFEVLEVDELGTIE